MQERNYSFEELRADLLEKLRNQGCSPITITGYRYQCNSIFKWMRRNDYGHYSVEGGNRYLQDYCAKHGENQYYTTLTLSLQENSKNFATRSYLTLTISSTSPLAKADYKLHPRLPQDK